MSIFVWERRLSGKPVTANLPLTVNLSVHMGEEAEEEVEEDYLSKNVYAFEDANR